MARQTSWAFRNFLIQPNVTDPAVALMTFTHESDPEPLRICSVPVKVLSLEPYRMGIISNGLEYDFIMSAFEWPDDEEGVPPVARFVIQNVDSAIAEKLRSWNSPPMLDIACVLASAPDILEFQEPELSATIAVIGRETIAIDFSSEIMTNERWPWHGMVKQYLPAIFRT